MWILLSVSVFVFPSCGVQHREMCSLCVTELLTHHQSRWHFSVRSLFIQEQRWRVTAYLKEHKDELTLEMWNHFSVCYHVAPFTSDCWLIEAIINRGRCMSRSVVVVLILVSELIAALDVCGQLVGQKFEPNKNWFRLLWNLIFKGPPLYSVILPAIQRIPSMKPYCVKTGSTSYKSTQHTHFCCLQQLNPC